jgi:hypothetical protein
MGWADAVGGKGRLIFLSPRDNPAGHVSRGGRFDPTHNLLALHQHGVSVRASYINTYALLHGALLSEGLG